MKNKKNRLAHNVSSSPEVKTTSGSDEIIINDDLILHPTIQAIKALTGYMPKKVIWELLIKTFPDGLDMDRAKEALERWAAKGWNPLNLDWLFNWYMNDYYYEHPKDNERWEEIQHAESEDDDEEYINGEMAQDLYAINL
jgi:hypothetical protein